MLLLNYWLLITSQYIYLIIFLLINKNQEEIEDIESETQNNNLNNEMIKLNLLIND